MLRPKNGRTRVPVISEAKRGRVKRNLNEGRLWLSPFFFFCSGRQRSKNSIVIEGRCDQTDQIAELITPCETVDLQMFSAESGMSVIDSRSRGISLEEYLRLCNKCQRTASALRSIIPVRETSCLDPEAGFVTIVEVASRKALLTEKARGCS